LLPTTTSLNISTLWPTATRIKCLSDYWSSHCTTPFCLRRVHFAFRSVHCDPFFSLLKPVDISRIHASRICLNIRSASVEGFLALPNVRGNTLEFKYLELEFRCGLRQECPHVSKEALTIVMATDTRQPQLCYFRSCNPLTFDDESLTSSAAMELIGRPKVLFLHHLHACCMPILWQYSILPPVPRLRQVNVLEKRYCETR
jgi:hypothetical protein